jgi:hypothetical protein
VVRGRGRGIKKEGKKNMAASKKESLRAELEKLYTVSEYRTRYVPRFKTNENNLKIRIKPPHPRLLQQHDLDPVQFIDAILTLIFNDVLKNVSSTDYVGLTLNSTDLDYELFVPYQLKRKFGVEQVLAELLKISQSDKKNNIYESFHLRLSRVKMDAGGTGVSILNYQRWLKSKTSVVSIKNNDKLCLARCLAILMARHRSKAAFRRLYKDGKLQKKQALALHLKAGVPQLDEGCTLNEVETFQKYLHKYQIVAFQRDISGQFVTIYMGPIGKKKLCLLLDENHWYGVLKPNVLYKRRFFCFKCLKGYNNKKHSCAIIRCQQCHGTKYSCALNRWRRCKNATDF